MSSTDWIIVAAAVLGGFVLGGLASRLTHSALAAPSRPKPLREAAKPLSGLVFWVCVIAGLMVALGVLQPEALAEIPKDVIDFLPRLLSAAIIVIGANVLSAFVLAGMGSALSRAPASIQRQVRSVVRLAIIGLGALLAVGQLGIDTTVLNLGLAAIFFGLAGSMVLLVGLGGRSIAEEVASTRVLRRMLRIGDEVELDGLPDQVAAGRVVAVHPTAIELENDDGTIQMVPSSRFTNETVTVRHRAPGPMGEPSQ